MAIDLAGVMNQIGEFQKVLMGDKATASGALEQNRQLGAERVAAAEKLIGTATRQAEIENEQKLRMEERKAAAAAAFGTDILDPNNRLAILANEQAAAVDEAIANSKRARDLKDMNLFDSPLDYFLVRPFAHRNDNAAVAAAERAKIAEKAINDLNQQTQATVQTQTMINEAFTKEQAALRLDKVKADAEEALRVLRMNQNTQLINDLTVLRGMDEKAIQMNVTGYKLKNEAAEFAARMALHREQLAERKKAKGEEKLGLEVAMAAYNKSVRATGGAPEVTNIEQFTAMAKSFATKDIIAARVKHGMESGEDVYAPAAVIANTPGATAMTLAGFGAKIDDGTKTGKLLNSLAGQTKDQVDSTARGQGKKATPEMYAHTIDGKMLGMTVTKQTKEGPKTDRIPGIVEIMAANAESPALGNNNIYQAADPRTIGTTYAKLTVNNWWKEIIAPASLVAPNPSADQMMRQAMLAVVERRVTPEEAAVGLNTYYKAAVALNNATEQYQRKGIPTQKSYVANVIKGNKFFGGERTAAVDMFDEKAVLRTLIMNTVAAEYMRDTGVSVNEQEALRLYEGQKTAARINSREEVQQREAAIKAKYY